MMRFVKTHSRLPSMPIFPGFPFPRRYNSLRLLGYDYRSAHKLCAITLVTDLRRPLFADMILAKNVLGSLLSDETLDCLRLTRFHAYARSSPFACRRSAA